MKKQMRKVSVFIFTSIMILLCGFLQAEDKKPEKKSADSIKRFPVQSIYTDRFKIKDIYFNKRLDLGGVGEILEVELILKTLIDDPQDLNIFVIASYEKKRRKDSSFLIPIPPQKKTRSFVPYPKDITNFQYPDIDKNGKIQKDEKGMDRFKLVKYPKDPKKGFNLKTGKPYKLKDKLVLRTQHLSKYRHNYFFFNEVTVLVFDSNGKALFRQIYELKGYRR